MIMIDWYEPPAIQSASEAGDPVQLCLPHTACLQGNFLFPELPGELQTHQLGKLHHSQDWISDLLLHQHCKYLIIELQLFYLNFNRVLLTFKYKYRAITISVNL